MAHRITISTLRKQVEILNRMAGNPDKTWTQVDGRNVSHVGSYVLDCAYGGYRVARIVNDAGGESNISDRAGAAETYAVLQALMYGYRVIRTEG